MVKIRSIVFPGRFQPVSNAHVERILWVLQKYPVAKLTVVVGEVGVQNKLNFLTVDERKCVFESIFARHGIGNVQIVVVTGCSDGCVWSSRVIAAVPEADAVLSDNPFVYIPLCRAGLIQIQYKREGINSSQIRDLKFSEWKRFIPPSEWKQLNQWNVKDRIRRLCVDGDKYPFLSSS